MTNPDPAWTPEQWDAALEEAVRRWIAELGPIKIAITHKAKGSRAVRAHARTLLELGWRPEEKVSDAVLCWREQTGCDYTPHPEDHRFEIITHALKWAADRANAQ